MFCWQERTIRDLRIRVFIGRMEGKRRHLLILSRLLGTKAKGVMKGMGLERLDFWVKGDFTVTSENADLSNGPPWDAHEADHRMLVSAALENDEEFVRRSTMILENIVVVLDEAQREILLTYMKMMQEQYETAVCMGDMIAYDAKTVRKSESEK